jgi:signal peptidase I
VSLDSLHTEVVPEQNPDQQQSSQGGVRRMILDVLETLILSVVLFLGINAVSARIRVESISMQPNLYAGDFVIVNKLHKAGHSATPDTSFSLSS